MATRAMPNPIGFLPFAPSARSCPINLATGSKHKNHGSERGVLELKRSRQQSSLQKASVRFAYSGLFLASLVFMGCGGSSETHSSAADSLQVLGIMDLTDPEAPVSVEVLMSPEVSRIAPGDEIRIDLFGHEEVSDKYVVTRNGKINLPLLGTLHAADKTIDSLDVEITEKFGDYYRYADVSVNIMVSSPRSAFFLGEVEKPGRHDFLPGDRLLHGLATAGGMSRQARSDNVVLMRRMPDGKEHAYRLAFNKLHAGVYPQDIYLKPGDVVFVPRTRFFTFTEYASEFLNVLSRAATTALIVDDLVGLRTRALTVGR